MFEYFNVVVWRAASDNVNDWMLWVNDCLSIIEKSFSMILPVAEGSVTAKPTIEADDLWDEGNASLTNRSARELNLPISVSLTWTCSGNSSVSSAKNRMFRRSNLLQIVKILFSLVQLCLWYRLSS